MLAFLQTLGYIPDSQPDLQDMLCRWVVAYRCVAGVEQGCCYMVSRLCHLAAGSWASGWHHAMCIPPCHSWPAVPTSPSINATNATPLDAMQPEPDVPPAGG